MTELKVRLSEFISNSFHRESYRKDSFKPLYFERLAQELIDLIVDDGQYMAVEDKPEGCCPDCTAAHNALWAKIHSLEERLDKAAEAHHKKKLTVDNGGQMYTCQKW